MAGEYGTCSADRTRLGTARAPAIDIVQRPDPAPSSARTSSPKLTLRRLPLPRPSYDQPRPRQGPRRRHVVLRLLPCQVSAECLADQQTREAPKQLVGQIRRSTTFYGSIQVRLAATISHSPCLIYRYDEKGAQVSSRSGQSCVREQHLRVVNVAGIQRRFLPAADLIALVLPELRLQCPAPCWELPLCCLKLSRHLKDR